MECCKENSLSKGTSQKRAQSIPVWCRGRAGHRIGESDRDQHSTWNEFKLCFVLSAQILFFLKTCELFH